MCFSIAKDGEAEVFKMLTRLALRCWNAAISISISFSDGKEIFFLRTAVDHLACISTTGNSGPLFGIHINQSSALELCLGSYQEALTMHE